MVTKGGYYLINLRGADGGDATPVSSTVSETFTSVAAFDGSDGGKSKGKSVQTGEYWSAISFVGYEIAPQAPKYELVEFEAGAGGASGTSYINKNSEFYYGDAVSSDVSSSDAYKNAVMPQTSGITITFILECEK